MTTKYALWWAAITCIAFMAWQQTARAGVPIVPEEIDLQHELDTLVDQESRCWKGLASLEKIAEHVAQRFGTSAIPFLKEKAERGEQSDRFLALLTLAKLESPESIAILAHVLETTPEKFPISYLSPRLARTLLEQAARKSKPENLYGLHYTDLLAVVGDKSSLALLESIQKQLNFLDVQRVQLVGFPADHIERYKRNLHLHIDLLKNRLSLKPDEQREWDEQELNFWRASQTCTFYRDGVHLWEKADREYKHGIRYSAPFLRSKIHIACQTPRAFLAYCPADLFALTHASGRKELLPDMQKYIRDDTLKGDYARRAMASLGIDEVLRTLEGLIEPVESKRDMNDGIAGALGIHGDEKALTFLTRLCEDTRFSEPERCSFRMYRWNLKSRLEPEKKEKPTDDLPPPGPNGPYSTGNR